MTSDLPSIPQPGLAAREARLTTILMIGRIEHGMYDDLCRVRNISTRGMRIETLAKLRVGDEIEIGLTNGVTVACRVMWMKQCEAGVRFDAPIDIEYILAPGEPDARAAAAPSPRSIRLSAQCPVALRRNGYLMPSVLTNISHGGAQLSTNATVQVGNSVVLCIPGLGSRHATIRWARASQVGLSFDEKLRFAELSPWLAGPHRFPPDRDQPLSQSS